LIPWNLLQLGIAQLIWLSILALSHLLYRDSQRAEYLADYLAATVSGTEAAQSLIWVHIEFRNPGLC